jgi:hypothetical protein
MKNFLLIILLIVMQQVAFSQSENDSIVIKTYSSGCDDVYVECFLSSFQMKDNYCWDFGDGTVNNCFSYTNEAKHRYTLPGTYIITLIITTDGIIDTLKSKSAITVRNSPVANFTIKEADINKYAPYQANFINNSLKGDGDTLAYSWSINNQEFSNDTNPTYVFESPSTYFIALNVRDNYGCQSNYEDYLIIKDTLQKHEFNYITSSCLSEGTSPCGYLKHFVIKDNTVQVYGFIGGNCCSEKTATAIIVNDTIYIRTFESGLMCTCSCGYCFEIIVPDINKDSVPVVFDNQLYMAKSDPVSTGKYQINNQIKIYPNPTSKDLIVDFPEVKFNNIKIEICDMRGQTIYREKNLQGTVLEINLGRFESGIYLIKIFEDETIFYLNKIIVDK